LKEKILSYFLTCKGMSELTKKYFLVVLTSRRLVLINLGSKMSAKEKIGYLLYAFIMGAIGKIILGDPGVVAGVGLATSEIEDEMRSRRIFIPEIDEEKLDLLMKRFKFKEIPAEYLDEVHFDLKKKRIIFKVKGKRMKFDVDERTFEEVREKLHKCFDHVD